MGHGTFTDIWMGHDAGIPIATMIMLVMNIGLLLIFAYEIFVQELLSRAHLLPMYVWNKLLGREVDEAPATEGSEGADRERDLRQENPLAEMGSLHGATRPWDDCAGEAIQMATYRQQEWVHDNPQPVGGDDHILGTIRI